MNLLDYRVVQTVKSPGEFHGLYRLWGSQRVRYAWATFTAQTVKCLPAMWETRVWSLGREDPLEEEMAAHSSILAWEISWTERLSDYSPKGCKESDTVEWLTAAAESTNIALVSWSRWKSDMCLIPFLIVWQNIANTKCYCSVSQLCPTLCDPMDCSTPGFPVLHHLPELA